MRRGLTRVLVIVPNAALEVFRLALPRWGRCSISALSSTHRELSFARVGVQLLAESLYVESRAADQGGGRQAEYRNFGTSTI